MSRVPNNRPHPPKGDPPKKPKPGKKRTGRRIIDALCAADRKTFLLEWPKCMICRKAPSCDAHEITRGIGRQHALVNERLMLSVCRRCHSKIDDASQWPIEKQLALRTVHEIEASVLDACEARGRDAEAIDAAEVYEYMEDFYGT